MMPTRPRIPNDVASGLVAACRRYLAIIAVQSKRVNERCPYEVQTQLVSD